MRQPTSLASRRIVECRKALGLSQSALAVRLGVSFATVNRWERGRTSPSQEMLARLHALEQIVAHPATDARLPALPPAANRFFGREPEVEEAVHALERFRLVTISGPGGCGKTRLALETANRISSRRASPSWFAGLDALSPGAGLASAVAGLLGAADAGEPVDAIALCLGVTPALLVLDNCEHLIGEVSGLVVELLARCPALWIIATSREPLHISTGHVVRLEPFAPNDEDATALFLDRAARAGWLSSEQDLPAVRGLCAGLDGLPLAIELAASLAQAIAPASLLRRLDDRLDLLTADEHDRPARHRGLRAALSWSYELLNPAEQRIFERLSIFPGAFTLEAAEAACGSATPADELSEAAVMLTLARLVQKSLVQVRPAGTSREYLLLETVRLFAREVAAARPRDVDRTKEQLVEWALSLAAAAEEKLEGRHQEAWLRALDEQTGPLRAALTLAIETRNAVASVALVGSLHRYWHTRSRVREGLDWATRALRIPGDVPEPVRAKALLAAGVLARQRGDLNVAASFLEEYLDIQLERGDIVGIARAHNSLAGALHGAGRSSEARAMLELGLGYWRQSGDLRGLASALSNLGIIACDEADYETAERLGREALEIRRGLGHAGSLAISLENLATVALRSGRLEEARERLAAALNSYITLDEPDGIATCLEGFAALAAKSIETETAILLYGAASAIRDDIDVVASAGDIAFHDPIRRRLRDSNPAQFESVLQRGRSLSRDQYLALALSPSTGQRPHLTLREAEVLHLLVRGDSNKEIARSLGVSQRTVNGHLTNIYRKLGARGRTEAVALAFRTRIT